METVIAHSGGNPRAMMNLCEELLSSAIQHEKLQLDEKLYIELYTVQQRPKSKGGK